MNRRLVVVPLASVTLAAPTRTGEPTARQWGLAVSAGEHDDPGRADDRQVVSLVVAADADIRDAGGAALSLDRIAVGDVVEWVAESQGELWIARQLSVTSGPPPGRDASPGPAAGAR